MTDAEERFASNAPEEPEQDAGDNDDPVENDTLSAVAAGRKLEVDGGQEQRPHSLDFPVVAIGASAGGLQAFQGLIRNLAPDTGMSFVLVTHLAPDQRSYLTEILTPATAMPVSPIENGQRLEPNHLYVLLPNELASLERGRFRVEPRHPGSRSPMPIDLFFRSLAADQKNYAIGVVLSGADSDGASGLKAIKGEGGLALVQAPETATHGSMPRSSIAADHVDLVKPPDELGIELTNLARQFVSPGMQALESGEGLDGDEQQYQRILQLMRGVSGLEFKQYKPQTLRRRIARRMMLMHIESLGDYARFLQVRPEELRLLQEDALINVTRFFRDPEMWKYLSAEILPSFFEGHSRDFPVRIWCAGCSSGEEAYSLAVLFLEYMAKAGIETTIQLFGTDASERSIEMARNGIYPETLQAEISEERLKRYFVKIDRGYQMAKRVRDLCIFARQNLTSDPPFSHMDFVSCRNVLIYLNTSLQKQVINTFHYALDAAGYLLLGASESLREYGEMFATVDRRHRIYTKVGIRVPHGYDMPPYFFTPRGKQPTRLQDGASEAEIWPEVDLQRAADRIVLARYGPPGLIVDERLNVLQSRGNTTPFIDLTSGPVSWNLARVLRESIAFQVKAAAERSVAENIPVTVERLMLRSHDAEHAVRAEVLPISSLGSRSRCYLILFEDAEELAGRSTVHPSIAHLGEDEKDQLIAQLRRDLDASRFHLQSLMEERDTRNQELISANEEIQSANEELQSTNEELETTKEELQSANEELQTVNEELQQRNGVLVQTGNDLNNLLTSVNIPLLMLNNELQIRQFTPPMQRLLSVRSTDIGRSINDIRLHLSVEDLDPILTDVLETLGTRELEVQDRDGRWYLLRVRPYRTSDNKIEGLVVLLMDIDQIRRSQQELREARDFSNSMLESVPIPVAVLNQDCTVRSVNTAFRELSQLPDSQVAGRSFPDLFQFLWGVDSMKEQLDNLRGSEPGTTLRFEHVSTTKRRQTLLIQGQALAMDGERAMLLTAEDVTHQRGQEEMLTREKAQLEQEIELSARKLERTEEELRALTAHLFTAQDEERRHVARELHDDISQKLSVLDLNLKDLQDKQGQRASGAQIDALRSHLAELASEVRRISHRLHPAILDDLGLPAALKALVEEFGEREEMPATYSGMNLPDRIPSPAAAALYRITQEALRNVAKHAGKTHVKVILKGTDDKDGHARGLTLQVIDLGVGFDQEEDVPRGGLGLISMTERARLAHGNLSIASALGKGTTLTVDLPTGQDE